MPTETADRGAGETSDGTVAAETGIGTGTGANGDAEPYCHHDCVSMRVCQDGVVKTYSNVPVPCKFWTGECTLDGPALPCQKGCRTDMGANPSFYDISLPAQNLCAEAVAKAVGSPCQGDADCLGAAQWGKYGPVNMYLACDTSATGLCVAAPPPVVADWGETCGLKGLAKYVSYTPANILPAPGCQSGLCFVQGGYTCSVGVRAGCTKACAHDWECPQGALCKSVATVLQSGNVEELLHCVPVASTPGLAPWYCRTDVL